MIEKLTTLFSKKQNRLKPFIPRNKSIPEKLINVPSAWKGLETIIEEILNQFQIDGNSCIEFGVEFGYSAVVFSNYFKKVTGIDTFVGDEHTYHKEDHYIETKNSLKNFNNIELFKIDYKDWIKRDTNFYDFAHVDIVHKYEETFECGLWAVQHSKCCIFHDTESFPEVKRAVIDIARKTGKKLYNYPHNFGLGIIV